MLDVRQGSFGNPFSKRQGGRQDTMSTIDHPHPPVCCNAASLPQVFSSIFLLSGESERCIAAFSRFFGFHGYPTAGVTKVKAAKKSVRSGEDLHPQHPALTPHNRHWTPEWDRDKSARKKKSPYPRYFCRGIRPDSLAAPQKGLGSNCKLTGGSGAWGRIRTTDTRIFNPLLYQLSYPGAEEGGL